MAIRKILSSEDRNLSGSTLDIKTRVSYSDIDLSMLTKPSGDIYKKTDVSAVKQAVKNLIMTNYYEKPFDPFFGANITGLLFELADDDTGDEIKDNIIEAIAFYEPRVTVLDIQVMSRPGANSVSATITFQIKTTEEVTSITANLSRLR